MERMNKVVPLQLISEENESHSDPETIGENGDDSDEETVSRPTITSKISSLSNDSILSGQVRVEQPRQSRNTASKSHVRFGIRRRRSSFEKVLKESEKSNNRSKTSRRTSSFLSILQCDKEHNVVTNLANGFETKTYNATERTDERTDERSMTLLRYVSEVTNSDKVDASIDLEQLRTMIKSGVPVDATDIYGQCLLHEAARSWSIEVAKVLVEEGAKVNMADKFGRTPLHVAASVDYNAMVKFLLEKGANVEAKTIGENQTPLHYAARHEAVACVKTLLIFDAEIDARDFKQRTPLQVAAEHDSAEAAEVLLNKGASAMVKDDNGLSVLSLLIFKMPSVALRAMDQFHIIDRTHRKQYLYLKSIENLENSQGSVSIPSPLQAVVETDCYELIMHPLFQRLIEIKWNYLGRRGAWLDIVPNVFLAILYTVLGVTFPDKVNDYYQPLAKYWWRIVIEIIVLSLLINEVRKEIIEFVSSKAQYVKWIEWRSEDIKRDLQYCHPRRPQERMFVERQVETASKQRKATYFQDVWNFLDWIAYAMLTVVFILHFVSVAQKDDEFNKKVIQFMSITLIVIWIRMLKFARPFPTQGPFVVILDHIIVDTFKWSFVFLMIYIPYAAAFWMNFGGRTGKPVSGYSNVSELMFTTLRFPIVDSNEYDGILEASPVMSRLLCGTYLVIGALILMNMYIALMSNTFQRVYDNATATAVMQRARLIQVVEPHHLLNPDEQYRDFISSHCCPEQRDYLVIMTEQEDQNRKQEEKISRLHSIINLRLGGKKFGKLDKSEFELALEDIDSLKASVMKMNRSLTTLAERLEEIAENIHHDVGSLGISQTQIITQLKVDQERDLQDLKGELSTKTESLKHFQAKKIEELAAFHAESVGDMKIAHAVGQGELALRQAQNTEELKVLQAEGVEEIKFHQALGFADLKFTQVQCSEELKPPPVQPTQSNRRTQHQELKPFQLQMLEDLKLAKEQKFQDLKASQEQDFQEISLFQATTFENLKQSNQQEFKEMAASKDEKFEKLTRTHAHSWAGQRSLDMQTGDSSGAGKGIQVLGRQFNPMRNIADMSHIQSKAIDSAKNSQAKKIADLKHLQASNFERLKRSQAESLFQLKQPPENLASLSAKYEKLEKERERALSEEKYIGGLIKLYAIPKGVSKGREARRESKVSKAWAQKLEREQAHAIPSEEERSENESLKSLSAKSEGRGECVQSVENFPSGLRAEKDVMHETETNACIKKGLESFVALEELSEVSNSSSPEAIPDKEENKIEHDYLVGKKASGPEHILDVKPGTNDSQVKPPIEQQENELENASGHDKEDSSAKLDESHRGQDTHNEGTRTHSVKTEGKNERDLTNVESSTSLAAVSGVGNKTEQMLDSKKKRENAANKKEQDKEVKKHKEESEVGQKTMLSSFFSKKRKGVSKKSSSKEVKNVERSEEGRKEEKRSVRGKRRTNNEDSEDNTTSFANAGSKPEAEYILTETQFNSGLEKSCDELEVVNKTDSEAGKEAVCADTSEHDAHERELCRVDQFEDEKNTGLDDTNSAIQAAETQDIIPPVSRAIDLEDTHQTMEEENENTEDGKGAKVGAQRQEKGKGSGAKEPRKKRSESIQIDEPTVGLLRDVEREAGPTRSSNEHIASLMKLYGGMKGDMTNKRPSKKTKTVKATKKSN